MRTQALLRVPLPLCPANLALQSSNLSMLSHLSAFPSRVLSVSLVSVYSCPGCGGRDKNLAVNRRTLGGASIVDGKD